MEPLGRDFFFAGEIVYECFFIGDVVEHPDDIFRIIQLKAVFLDYNFSAVIFSCYIPSICFGIEVVRPFEMQLL